MINKEANNNMTREQERTELHRAIWKVDNDLRGSVDGWDFKTYVLGMLFYRFISESGGSITQLTVPNIKKSKSLSHHFQNKIALSQFWINLIGLLMTFQLVCQLNFLLDDNSMSIIEISC